MQLLRHPLFYAFLSVTLLLLAQFLDFESVSIYPELLIVGIGIAGGYLTIKRRLPKIEEVVYLIIFCVTIFFAARTIFAFAEFSRLMF